eukprot:gb/GECG01015350.1/.p1 GENE.gb/GECG01015350.1/~~gb/GECG01015350.1/.p1  ORF type:complete len:137 (+),score=21.82 gb/GECG01015350.1/:1-411(+)
MSEPLHAQKCSPCVGKEGSELELLPGEQIEHYKQQICPSWELMDDGKAIERKFVAKNFQCALDAVNKYGQVAEEAGHHPDLSIYGYRNVSVKLSTHALGGLTDNDFIVAAKLDRQPVTYSPKFLRENDHIKAGREE